MMPEADIVALSTSVSNHWSRKSAALMVISCTWLYLSVAGHALEAAAEEEQLHQLAADSAWSGSGGIMLRIGLTNRHIASIALPNSS